MEDWTTVKVRRKDPGGPGGAQAGKEKAVEEVEMSAEPDFGSLCKIRAEYIHKGRNGAFKASAEAKQLCGHLLRIDPKISFKNENDTSLSFNKMANFPAGNKFKEFFATTTYTRNDGSGKVHLNFIIESEMSIAAFKGDMTFMKFIRERKIWITEHKYETNELQAIGYIVNKSPVLTHRPQLEQDIASAFTEYIERACDEDKDYKYIPDMEIGTKKIVHVLREGNKKTGVMETQALEVRCEKAHARRLKHLFFNADLSENHYGKFVPYEIIKSEQSVVKSLINEHNKFLSEIAVLPIFGIHEDVLTSIVDGLKEHDKKGQLFQKIQEIELTKEDEDTGKVTKENAILSIEQTLRTDDLGKWFLIFKKENAEHVNNLIDRYLIPTAEKTDAYKNHRNDNESYKLGVRRTNKTNTNLQSYVETLRESLKHEVTENTGKYDKYDYTKKRKTIQIEYDTEFPELNPANKRKNQQQTTKKHNNSANKSGRTMATTNDYFSDSTDSTDSKGSNDSVSALRNSMEAQMELIKLRMDEMQQRQDEMAKQQEDFFKKMNYFITYNHDSMHQKSKEDAGVSREQCKSTQAENSAQADNSRSTSRLAPGVQIEERLNDLESAVRRMEAILNALAARESVAPKRKAMALSSGDIRQALSRDMDIDESHESDDNLKQMKQSSAKTRQQTLEEMLVTASPKQHD